MPRIKDNAVASSATSTLTRRAARAPSECAAADHHCNVRPLGGQANDLLMLNELSTTSASGA